MHSFDPSVVIFEFYVSQEEIRERVVELQFVQTV